MSLSGRDAYPAVVLVGMAGLEYLSHQTSAAMVFAACGALYLALRALRPHLDTNGTKRSLQLYCLTLATTSGGVTLVLLVHSVADLRRGGAPNDVNGVLGLLMAVGLSFFTWLGTAAFVRSRRMPREAQTLR